MVFYELAALLEIALVVVESLGILKPGALPLGGGHIQQIGIIFGTAFVVDRLIALLHRK